MTAILVHRTPQENSLSEREVRKQGQNRDLASRFISRNMARVDSGRASRLTEAMQLDGASDMAVSREELFRQALQLDESERAALVGMLIDSIDSDGEEGVEAAWMVEIERRIVELDRGSAKTIPWDVVRDGLRQRLGG